MASTRTATTSNFLSLTKGNKAAAVQNFTDDQSLLTTRPANSKDDYWLRILDYTGREVSQTINNGAVPFFYSSLPRPDRKSPTNNIKSERKNSSTPSSPSTKSHKAKKRSSANNKNTPSSSSPAKKRRGRPRKDRSVSVAPKSRVSTNEDDIADFLADVGTTPIPPVNVERAGSRASNSNANAGDAADVSSSVGGHADAAAAWSSVPLPSANREHKINLSASNHSRDPNIVSLAGAIKSSNTNITNDVNESTSMSFNKYFRFRLSSHQLQELNVSPDNFTVHKAVKKPRNPMHVGDTIVSINGQRMESIDEITRAAWLSGELVPSHPMTLETYGERSFIAPPTFVIGGKILETAVLLQAVESSIEISEDARMESADVSADEDEGSVWFMVQMAVLGMSSTPSELLALQETYERYFGHVVMPRGR